MPVHLGRDEKGWFYQWGQHGHKYRFRTWLGGERAKKRAAKQGQAAHAHGYRESS